ncbi:MAG: NTP transferase domain-containing protein [Chitinophagales bacterium]
MNKTGIIILAGGPSLRLGKPKQLLMYQGKTLVEHISSAARKANLFPTIVVTGANSKATAKVLTREKVEIMYNDQWPSGMASGIVAGLLKILEMDMAVESVIIAVCDQPFVSAGLFTELIKIKAEKNKGIVGSAYAGTVGTPVLFGKTYFEELLLLKGDEGAKKLLKAHAPDLVSVPFEQGSIDIDTEQDYKQLLSQTSAP